VTTEPAWLGGNSLGAHCSSGRALPPGLTGAVKDPKLKPRTAPQATYT